MDRPEELAARAAAAALAGAHEVSHTTSPCATIDEVSDALLGLPDEAGAGAILDHAEDCDVCGAYVAEVEMVIELARFAYPDQMPSAVSIRLKAMLEAEAVTRTGVLRTAPAPEAFPAATTPDFETSADPS